VIKKCLVRWNLEAGTSLEKNNDYRMQTGEEHQLGRETNGNLNKAIGPAKMVQVSAGDRVQLEVFARYATGTGSNNTLITNLASAVTGSFALTAGESAHTALTNNVPPQAASIGQTTGVPKAYLFYILFNNSYVYQQFGYVAVNSTALANHQQMYLDITVPTGGYLYTYVANEANVSSATSVYFDDFTIVHTRNAPTLQVLQTNDYYPFGLTFNSYSRENSVAQDFKYNGKELQDELNLNWLDYGARQYDPAIARFTSVDPAAELMRRVSPYAYSFNNPVRFTDPDGMIPSDMVENDRPCIGCAGPAGRREEEPPQSLHDFFETGSRSNDDGKGWSGGGMRMPRIASLGEYAGNDKQSDTGGSESNANAGGKKGGTRIGNALRILGSLFAVSKNKTLGGKILQVLSHLTWELPQQLAGIVTAEVVNAVGGIKNAYFKDGALVLESKFIGANVGYTLGNILTVGVGSSQSTISHEYGHYMQSRIFGPGYIPIFAVPSVARASVLSVGWMFGGFQNVQYDAFYTERSATRLGQKFWGDD